MTSWIARLASILLLLSTGASPEAVAIDPSASLEVVVKGLRSRRGALLVQVFAEPNGFPNDDTRAARRVKVPIEEPTPRVAFSALPYGDYAISVCHDANGNGRCDANMLGIPTEGVGASNDSLRRFGPPRFDAARVRVEAAHVEIAIRVEYR